jgi:uncharacterized membrane protein
MRLSPTSLRLAAVATGACLALVELRVRLTGSDDYRFLGWNLFLAWLPPVLAAIATWRRLSRAAQPLRYAFAFLWLLFLPNAPYLVTDFLHLRIEGTDHLWIDLPMLTSGSLAGMVLGLSSLRSMHTLVEDRLGSLTGWVFVAVISALVGPALYLGRVLRLNSWQVVSHPAKVLDTVAGGLAHPVTHLRSLVLIWLCASLFAAAYVVALRWETPRAGEGRRR